MIISIIKNIIINIDIFGKDKVISNNLFMINMATGNTRVDDAIDNKCNKNNLLNKFNLTCNLLYPILYSRFKFFFKSLI